MNGIFIDVVIKEFKQDSGIIGAFSRNSQGYGIGQLSYSGNFYIWYVYNTLTNGGIYSNKFIDDMWGSRHQYTLLKSNVYIDGKLITEKDEEDVNCTTNCYIFGMSGITMQNKSSLKLYNVKLYDSSNKITKNFIPCYSTTTVTNANGVQVTANTKGLYDLVEGKFYTNQGTGEFIAGPEV